MRQKKNLTVKILCQEFEIVQIKSHSVKRNNFSDKYFKAIPITMTLQEFSHNTTDAKRVCTKRVTVFKVKR